VSGKPQMVNFTNSFHGMTLGSLAVTGNAKKRAGAGIPLVHSTPMPYDGYLDGAPDFELFERLLEDAGSSLNAPAGVIVETTQGEGGLNPARVEWLQGLAELCKRHKLLLIVDDVQMGCGRTGPFFSFEIAGIQPDIVCLSKSISGYGLPMALTLFKPEYDIWSPGEHNGTFRGQCPSFITGTAALRHYWSDDALEKSTAAKSSKIQAGLEAISKETSGTHVKGRGLALGLSFDEEPSQADKAAVAAFERGLLVETAGHRDQVLKLMPALTITDDEIDEGMEIVAESVRSVTR
jgi:diaminobutyrate-2-oxoglutarate transaminase